VLDLLLLFVRQPSLLLTKEEIFRVLWPDVAVTDNALTQVVSELRQALGDSPASPQFLQTVARRGYRFIAAVELLSPTTSAPADRPRGPAPVAARPGERSIVVLDFSNVTNDTEMAWLAAGLAETITNDLRAIRDLRVIDRAAARMAGMQGVADGAKAMGIDLAVVGSFQRAGDRVRITARVVDLETREALAHAKADGPLAEVFALQDAVVTQLSTGLQITVTSSAAQRISERETSSLAAYRSATEGRLKLEPWLGERGLSTPDTRP
jgi:TolB-like protein